VSVCVCARRVKLTGGISGIGHVWLKHFSSCAHLITWKSPDSSLRAALSSKNKTAQTHTAASFLYSLSQVSHCRQNYFARVCFSVSSIRANPRAVSREIYFQSKSRRPAGALLIFFWVASLVERRTTRTGAPRESARKILVSDVCLRLCIMTVQIRTCRAAAWRSFLKD